jgi:hypothetical protein
MAVLASENLLAVSDSLILLRFWPLTVIKPVAAKRVKMILFIVWYLMI